jgi:hypothetical protein
MPHLYGRGRSNLDFIRDDTLCFPQAWRSSLTERRVAMTEKAYGFGSSAIDELNRHSATKRLSTTQFALMVATLAALLILPLVQIIW